MRGVLWLAWLSGCLPSLDSLKEDDRDGDGSPLAEDCDDRDPDMSPDIATDACDGKDNDCDGEEDEDPVDLWYEDGDGDGVGAGDPTVACEAPEGFVALSGDCDDEDPGESPLLGEMPYNHRDDDCDPATSDMDVDGDGYGCGGSFDSDCPDTGGDCNDTDPNVHPGVEDDAYDGLNPDCSAGSDYDVDGDGYEANCDSGDTACDGLDCNDTAVSIHAEAEEIWYDGVDQACDGGDDFDQDGDGFLYSDAPCDTADTACPGTRDCKDTAEEVNPGEEETYYNGRDDDCRAYTRDLDHDRDGVDCDESHGDPSLCDGHDCDDNPDDDDLAVQPPAKEIYNNHYDDPYDGVDADCHGDADDLDQDQDGYDCDPSHGPACLGDDCQDDPSGDTGAFVLASMINPEADDTPYDGIDADCDGFNDFDADEDGFVSDLDHSADMACATGPCDPTREDCADKKPETNPNADEIWYDGDDQDCEGDDDFDQDGDGFVCSSASDTDCPDTGLDCDDDPTDDPSDTGDTDDAGPPGAFDVNPGVATDAPYDGVDANCDYADEFDLDGDGYPCDDAYGGLCDGDDCDESNALINPNTVWYADDDLDGAGAAPTFYAPGDCLKDYDGYVAEANHDCDDGNPSVQGGCQLGVDGDLADTVLDGTAAGDKVGMLVGWGQFGGLGSTPDADIFATAPGADATVLLFDVSSLPEGSASLDPAQGVAFETKLRDLSVYASAPGNTGIGEGEDLLLTSRLLTGGAVVYLLEGPFYNWKGTTVDPKAVAEYRFAPAESVQFWANGTFGNATAGAGAMDGHEGNEILIASSAWQPGDGAAAAGAFWLIYSAQVVPSGESDPSDVDVVGRRWDGEADADQFGHAIDGGEDVNCDGKPDIVVGAPGADPGGLDDAGKVYLFFGQDTAPSENLAADADASWSGTVAGRKGGRSVALVRDVDADGCGDIVAGGSGSDTPGVALVYGSADISGHGMDLDAHARFEVDAEHGNSLFGEALGWGDSTEEDGDARSDLMIGAPSWAAADGGGNGVTGAMYVYLGRQYTGVVSEDFAVRIFTATEASGSGVGHPGGFTAIPDADLLGHRGVVFGLPEADARSEEGDLENAGALLVVVED